jgi:hypothetical protein
VQNRTWGWLLQPIDHLIRVLSVMGGVATIVGWFAVEWSWLIPLYALAIVAVVGLLWTSGILLRGGWRSVAVLRELGGLTNEQLPEADQRLVARLRRQAREQFTTAAIWGPGLAVLGVVAAREVADAIREDDPAAVYPPAVLGGIFVLVGLWRGLVYARRKAEEARRSLKTCPQCGEEIAAQARLCRFCRHAFDMPPGSPEPSQIVGPEPR